MPKSKKKRDPLPESFKTIDEFVEFWDTHSTADYPEAFRELNEKVIVRQRRHFGVSLGARIGAQLEKRAHAEGVSLEALVNKLLADQLRRAA